MQFPWHTCATLNQRWHQLSIIVTKFVATCCGIKNETNLPDARFSLWAKRTNLNARRSVFLTCNTKATKARIPSSYDWSVPAERITRPFSSLYLEELFRRESTRDEPSEDKNISSINICDEIWKLPWETVIIKNIISIFRRYNSAICQALNSANAMIKHVLTAGQCLKATRVMMMSRTIVKGNSF